MSMSFLSTELISYNYYYSFSLLVDFQDTINEHKWRIAIVNESFTILRGSHHSVTKVSKWQIPMKVS